MPQTVPDPINRASASARMKATKSKPRVFTNTMRAVDRLTLPAETHDVLRSLLGGGAPYLTGLALRAFAGNAEKLAKCRDAWGDVGKRHLQLFKGYRERGGIEANLRRHLVALEAEGFCRLETQIRTNSAGERDAVEWIWPIPLEMWRVDHFLAGLALIAP